MPLRPIPALDGARGIAVLLVMAYHFEFLLPQGGFWGAASSVFGFGWMGVDLFFALSGFLITSILLETRGSPRYYSAFYMRRVLRIVPISYLVLAAVFVAAPMLKGLPLPPSADRPLYFAYLQNWIAVWRGSWPLTMVSHFWSLAVEEQFYLAWPFVVAVFGVGVLRRLAPLAVATAMVTRIALVYSGVSGAAIQASTLTRCDGLLLGAFCAYLYHERTVVDARLLSRTCLLAFVAFFALDVALPDTLASRFVLSLGPTFIAVGFASLVLRLATDGNEHAPLQRVFANEALRSIGRYSYGMYLYHLPLALLLQTALPLTGAVAESAAFRALCFALLCGATFGLAALSYRFVEAPILSLKRFFTAQPVQAGGAAAA